MIAIIAVILAGMAYENTKRDVTLALEDNAPQELDSIGVWSNIEFRRNLHISPAWHHTRGEESVVECRMDGIYRIFFSIQTSLSSTTSSCSEEELSSLMMRATIQYDGQGLLHEIHSSLTKGNMYTEYMGKEFLLNVEEGDLLRFQFYSLCPDLILSPPTVSSSSATLIISQ